GSPLADLVADNRRLGWGEVCALLEQLADELAAACADGTLPPELSLDHVWVQPGGQVQLLDFPLARSGGARVPANGAPQTRALARPAGPTTARPAARPPPFPPPVPSVPGDARPGPAGAPPPPPGPRAPFPAPKPLASLRGAQDPSAQVHKRRGEWAPTPPPPA